MLNSTVSPNAASGLPLSLAGPMAQAVLEMLGRAERAIDADPRQARIFIDQASRMLAPASSAQETPTENTPSGLAPWQERKITRHIAENLGQSISNSDLAALVGLSVNYFSRRFKSSFGLAPRDYIIRSRLERAKTLMTQTSAPLCEIALDSGFCDQAHLCRTFHQIVGDTPRRWRRARTLELAA